MNVPHPTSATHQDALHNALLTAEDMLCVLHISRRTLDSYLADNVIPQPFKIGRRLYWHREQIDRWLRLQARL
ncbi:helix-turn-helix transcriptional regulator [Craterilacuibacter sp.]|uniref:helix-turn-helix transcriptional regulator n=1 Tax=Craterilacuibacter sp. TaxID=2870909 RepID=UPI003F311B0D